MQSSTPPADIHHMLARPFVRHVTSEAYASTGQRWRHEFHLVMQCDARKNITWLTAQGDCSTVQHCGIPGPCILRSTEALLGQGTCQGTKWRTNTALPHLQTQAALGVVLLAAAPGAGACAVAAHIPAANTRMAQGRMDNPGGNPGFGGG